MTKNEAFALANEFKGCFNCGWSKTESPCDRLKLSVTCWMTVEEANEIWEQKKIESRSW